MQLFSCRQWRECVFCFQQKALSTEISQKGGNEKEKNARTKSNNYAPSYSKHKTAERGGNFPTQSYRVPANRRSHDHNESLSLPRSESRSGCVLFPWVSLSSSSGGASPSSPS